MWTAQWGPRARGRTSPVLELVGLTKPGSRLPSLPISQGAINYFPSQKCRQHCCCTEFFNSKATASSVCKGRKYCKQNNSAFPLVLAPLCKQPSFCIAEFYDTLTVADILQPEPISATCSQISSSNLSDVCLILEMSLVIVGLLIQLLSHCILATTLWLPSQCHCHLNKLTEVSFPRINFTPAKCSLSCWGSSGGRLCLNNTTVWEWD